MTTTVDRPPVQPQPQSRPEPEPPYQAQPARRGWFARYQQHVWVAAIAILAIAATTLPMLLVPGGTQTPSGRAPAPALPTSVTVTASEFKFTPTSIQVPLGQKVSITLDNKGVVEHDVTIQAAGFTLLAKAGQVATGEFTFDKAGVFEFICSIPGHKEAGRKGTRSVIDANAANSAVGAAAAPAAPATTSQPDIQPLPANLTPLTAPQVAPPITRTAPAYVKYDLETTKVVAQMADGVAYEYWTFNNTVPGPMLRVREGDTVEISLTNSPEAGLTHSIDLHAVTGPGGGAVVTQVMPGETGSFTFKALNPGVYVYHCATPMVAHHIASGMYGLIVVEPAAGLPAVDHEYYLMEGDFYLQGNRGDEGLRAFDVNKMLDERPDYVLFNGSAGANAGAKAFQANVGESIRIFFGVGGPNLTSSFHVIGEIFDRVYPEGALANSISNVQTTHVPAGGATWLSSRPKCLARTTSSTTASAASRRAPPPRSSSTATPTRRSSIRSRPAPVEPAVTRSWRASPGAQSRPASRS